MVQLLVLVEQALPGMLHDAPSLQSGGGVSHTQSWPPGVASQVHGALPPALSQLQLSPAVGQVSPHFFGPPAHTEHPWMQSYVPLFEQVQDVSQPLGPGTMQVEGLVQAAPCEQGSEGAQSHVDDPPCDAAHTQGPRVPGAVSQVQWSPAKPSHGASQEGACCGHFCPQMPLHAQAPCSQEQPLPHASAHVAPGRSHGAWSVTGPLHTRHGGPPGSAQAHCPPSQVQIGPHDAV